MTARQRRAAQMSFWEYLDELRARLFKCLLAVALGGMAAYYFREQIYAWLVRPLHQVDPSLKLNYFSPTEPFFVYLRIALFAGLVIAAPVVLYQLWAFIAPALTKREKRITLGMLLPVLLLFLSGVAFIYWWLLPFSIGFLLGLGNANMEAELNQDKYFSFITGLCLAGGLLFELPVVLGLLGYLELIDAHWLWRNSGYALVALMALAAVITPTGDAFNMLALTAPLMALYLASIIVVWLIRRPRRKNPPAAGV